MKVIEKGPGWSIEQYCTGKGNGDVGCQSKLLVEYDDIYLTAHTDLAGDTDYYYTFRCPVCGFETDIPSNEVPFAIRRKLLETKKSLYMRRK